MRFAETGFGTGARALVLVAACAAGAGCASLGDPVGAMRQAVGGKGSSTAESSRSAAAPTAADASLEGKAASKRAARDANTPVAATVISPASQRAFDEALRAQRAGRLDEAQRGFAALATAEPTLGGPHANLGILHGQAGRLDEAVAALELAVRCSPQQPRYFNELGIAYRRAGRFADAREAYETAIELDPAYAAPVLNLGILHELYLGDTAQALSLYGRYQALSASADTTVAKWVADLQRRKPEQALLVKKEQS